VFGHNEKAHKRRQEPLVRLARLSGIGQYLCRRARRVIPHGIFERVRAIRVSRVWRCRLLFSICRRRGSSITTGSVTPMRQGATPAICAVCLFFCGCVGFTPLPKRVKGQSGAIEKPFDLSFIQVGQTRRAEVEEKLKHFDVGLPSQNFFMARWSTASSAIIVENLRVSGSQRLWRHRNLLVEFGSAGMVKSYTVFTDHELISRLTTVLESQPPLDFSHPLEIDAQLGPYSGGGASGKLILTLGMFTFKEDGTPKKPHDFKVAVADITSMDRANFDDADPVHAVLVIHLHKKIRGVTFSGLIFGRHPSVYFILTVPDFVTILKFVEQSKQTT
jgi:hypothetical protein